MNVDEMEGRELDVLVAEKVMGWDIIRHSNGAIYATIPDSIEWYAIRWADGRDDDWSPSTDIAAVLPCAVQVVGSAGHIKIKLLPPDKDHKQCLAAVALWLGRAKDVHTLAEGTTGERAIALALARAVVKAKGVEEAAT